MKWKKSYNHILFWVLHTTYIFFVIYIQYPQLDTFDFIILRSLLILSFYINVFFVYKYLLTRITLLHGLLLFILNFCLYFGLKYVHHYIFLPFIGHNRFWQPFDLKSFSITAVINFIEFSLYALGYWYFRYSIKSQQELHIKTETALRAEQVNLELEAQKNQLQYNFLKAQINPHFLYNTLAFIYAKTKRADEGAANSVHLLTEIMRYALDDDKGDSMKSLDEEVEHMEKYIELNRLRFGDGFHLQYEKQGNTARIYIPHYTLIVFVENAFKHGIINDPKEPVVVHLIVEPEKWTFIVANKKNKARYESEEGGGLGLDNIKERLHMVYKDRHQLLINETNEAFHVHLSVNL
jgi:two-component system, LytTR family, sensor kinase